MDGVKAHSRDKKKQYNGQFKFLGIGSSVRILDELSVYGRFFIAMDFGEVELSLTLP